MPCPLDHRAALWCDLDSYACRSHAQVDVARRIQLFLESSPRCFDRSHSLGHMTGSAWLLNPSGNRALFTFHRKLQRWLQLGGHADGCADLRAVALREAQEESGILEIVQIDVEIFDLDVHLIPENSRSGEAAHYHYDVRYLFCAQQEDFICSDESDALAWMSVQELFDLGAKGSLMILCCVCCTFGKGVCIVLMFKDIIN